MKNGALSAAVALSVTALLAVPTLARADSQTAALVRKVKPAVVQVITHDASGKADKLGTGFFVNAAGDVITCRHVMEGAVGANVRTSGGVDYPVAGIIAEDVDGDMVKLGITGSDSSLPYLPLAPSQPSEGDPILVIGNPEGLGWTVSDGIVSAVRPIPGFGAMVQITAPISQGSSGSPVLNMKGQVVGLVDFYFAQGQNLNFAMPVSRIIGLKRQDPRPLKDWSAAPKESPKAAQDDISQGLSDISQGDYRSALNHFGDALKKDQNSVLALSLGGYCWLQLGNWSMAASCFEIVVKQWPDSEEMHYNLGLAYANLGRWQDAVEKFNEAIKLKPDDADAHCGLAIAYCATGQWSYALDAFREAIRLEPGEPRYHYALGFAYARNSQWEDAVKELQESIRLKPDYADAYLCLGVAYHNLKRYEDAVAEYKEAIRLKPDYSQAHLDLGLAYLVLGQRGLAVNEWIILKTLDASLADQLFKLIYP